MGYSYLVHARTPGSKNGERRYQNEDGTWTPLGLERRRAEYKSSKKGNNRIARGAVAALGTSAAIGNGVVGGLVAFKDKESMNVAFAPGKDNKASIGEKIARGSSDIMRSTAEINDALANNGKKYTPYTNDLSNADLEKMIRRMNLEQQYANLTTANVQRGRDRLDTIMKIGGGVVALGGTAAALLTAIAAIKRAKG